MKLTIEYKDPNDFKKLIRLMTVLRKDIYEFGFELQAEFNDEISIVDTAIEQLSSQYTKEVYD